MKLLIVCQNFQKFVSGHDRAIYDLTLALKDEIDVTVITARVPAQFREKDIRFVVIPSINIGKFLIQSLTFSLSYKIYYILGNLRNKYDFTYSSSVHFTPCDLCAVHFHSGAWLAKIWSMKPSDYGGFWRKWYQVGVQALSKGIECIGYGRAARRGAPLFLPVCSGLDHELIKRHRISPRQIKIVYNSIDLAEFKGEALPKGAEGAAARRRLCEEAGWDADSFVALFVGGGWGRKGLRFGIEALSSTSGRVKLCVVGEGNVSYFQAVADRLGAGDRIWFAGRRSDVAKLMRDADLLVLPSKFETLPMVCLEALASGLPLMLTPFWGARDLVDEGINGYIVETTEDAAKKIESLARDRDLCAHMSLMSKEKARMFDRGVMKNKMIEIFRSYEQEGRALLPRET